MSIYAVTKSYPEKVWDGEKEVISTTAVNFRIHTMEKLPAEFDTALIKLIEKFTKPKGTGGF